MADLKIVISDPTTGKSYQKDAPKKPFLGKKVGETLKGELIDMTGYEFLITGGTDDSGFPMRREIPLAGKTKVLEVSGVGVNNKKKYRKKKKKGLRTMEGMRQRVTVAGNTVYDKTAQVNLKVTKAGKEPLEKPAGPEAAAEGAASAEDEAPKEEAKAEAPAKAPKEEAKAEKKTAEEKKE